MSFKIAELNELKAPASNSCPNIGNGIIDNDIPDNISNARAAKSAKLNIKPKL